MDFVGDAFPFSPFRNDQVLEVKVLQILDGRGLPEVEAPTIFGRGDQREFDAGAEAEGTVAGALEVPIRGFVMELFVFLSATDHLHG